MFQHFKDISKEQNSREWRAYGRILFSVLANSRQAFDWLLKLCTWAWRALQFSKASGNYFVVKILNKYLGLATDWKKLSSLAFESTLDTKLREFQYKILNLIIFTNKKLHRFKVVDSPLCAFSNAEEESLEHLLYL